MLFVLLTILFVGAPVSPHVVRVENGGLLFTDNSAGVSGTDAGYSLPIGSRILWLFGDVFLLQPTDPARRYVGGVSNCGLLVPAGHGAGPLRRYTFLTDSRTGVARPLIPNAPGEGTETRLWPFGGWYDARSHRAYLYYARVRTHGTGAFDFRTEAHGLAVADTTDPERLTFRRLLGPDGSLDWWHSGRDPLLGLAVITGGSNSYLYLVGSRAGEHIVRMARVPRGRIADPAAYEYLSGLEPHWSRKPADSIAVPDLSGNPGELSISYNAYLGGYLAVHSVGISERIRLSLAPHPWGPYRVIGEIGAPHRAFQQAFCYAGKEHPELAEQGGRVIYVTYVDSQRYWLQLYRITLQR